MAQVCEVMMEKGKPAVKKIYAVADCGEVVNLSGARQQVMGGVVDGYGHAMFGKLTFKNGETEQKNYNTYRLIRMKEVRPRLLPGFVGMGSENGAVRFAVQWEAEGEVREGVYIARRFTNSRLNTLVGGRFFPGVHQHARFQVSEAHPYYQLALESGDGQTQLALRGTVRDRLPDDSLFASMDEASEFFRAGSLGYSDSRTAGVFDGLELRSLHWRLTALEVACVESTLFNEADNFPPGTSEFDCALFMRGIEHEWHARESLYAEPLRCAA